MVNVESISWVREYNKLLEYPQSLGLLVQSGHQFEDDMPYWNKVESQ